MARLPRWPLTASLTCALAISIAAHAGALLAMKSFRIGERVRVDSVAAPVQLLTLTPEPKAEISQATPPAPPPPSPEPQAAPESQAEAQREPIASDLSTPIATPAERPHSALRVPEVGAASPVPLRDSQEIEPATPTPETPQAVSFAGVEGVPASRIVYVLDGSGPMTSCLPLVKTELLRSVSQLAKVQTFRVIVTRRLPGSAQAVLESFPSSGFGSPTAAEQAELAVWLAEVQPRGASDPWSGLESSIASGPELVFLLTRSIRRSAGEDVSAANDRTLARLDALNPLVNGRRAVVIKSLQFVDEDPSGLLQRIAEIHGDGDASYRVISMQELGG